MSKEACHCKKFIIATEIIKTSQLSKMFRSIEKKKKKKKKKRVVFKRNSD